MNDLALRPNESGSGSSPLSYMELAPFLVGGATGVVVGGGAAFIGGQYLSQSVGVPEEEKGEWFNYGPATAGYSVLAAGTVPALSYLIFGYGDITKGAVVGAVVGGGYIAYGALRGR